MDEARLKAAQERLHQLSSWRVKVQVQYNEAEKALQSLASQLHQIDVDLKGARKEWEEAQKGLGQTSINTGASMVSSMPKPVRKEPEPAVEEEKSDTTIEPYKDEEKEQEQPKGPVGDEMKTAPAAKAEPSADEDEEFEEALKAIGTRFDNLEKAITALGDKFVAALEKSNYTSKPASVDSSYPTPPEDGPKSDGLQAPKIDQEDNPHSKPFGKAGKPLSAEAKKVALGGAGNGAVETQPVAPETVESLREMRAAILKGETSIAKENAKLALRKYGGQ